MVMRELRELDDKSLASFAKSYAALPPSSAVRLCLTGPLFLQIWERLRLDPEA